MGMRQNIKLVYSTSIVDEPSNRNANERDCIYIYSHWGGNETLESSELANRLHRALARRERWDDESYLARIIVSEVLRGDLDSATGYGIAPYEVGPEFPTITVDLANQTINGMTFEQFVALGDFVDAGV